MFFPSVAGRRARLFLITALASLIAVLQVSTASAATADAGRAHMARTVDTSFDVFTDNPTVAQKDWMRAHYWRMKTWSPYFDTRTGWAPKAWFYQSAYAIYVGGPVARDHPEWILRDAAGNKLYIPFGCKNGTCTQYAGDIGNPAFRSWWIAQAKTKLPLGYGGMWIDDVNLPRRVSDGYGKLVDPIDPRTNAVLTEPTWQRYMGEHMAAIRAAFPTAEIVHNAIWYAGDTTADQLKQLRSADLINLERGVNDAGLTGGSTGKWSLGRMLSFIDHRQAEGHGVIFEGKATTDAGRLYNLAAYFLVSSGKDGIANDKGSTPADWWKGYDVDLGAPLAARYLVDAGVYRRDFQRGFVLVNEPRAITKTVSLPAGARDLNGAAQTSVALPGGSGAVFTTASAPTPGTTTVKTTFTVPKSPTGTSATVVRSSASGAAQASAAPARLSLRVAVLPARRSARGRHVRISGRLANASGGRVKIVVRQHGRAIRRLGQRTRRGAFVRMLHSVRPGTYRVVATYRAHATVRSFSVHR